MKKVFLLIAFLFLAASTPVHAENFVLPSDGYLGWRYYQNTNGYEGINGTYHTGIDIWSNANGGWNSDGGSNPIYAAYPGHVFFRDYLGLQIKHNDNLYTNYWHVKDFRVALNNNVDTNTLLGFQDNAGVVHVHVTITTTPLTGNNRDHTAPLDPSPYFGVQLDVRNPNVLPYGARVERNSGQQCNVANVIISREINGNFTCRATNFISIRPNSRLFGGQQRYFIN